MCLAAYKPAGSVLPIEHVREAMSANPHGAGLAIATKDGVKIIKGLWMPRHVEKVLRRYADCAIAFHARYATHGAVNKRNCHPFRVSPDCAVVHNGVISGLGSEHVSDTAEFTDMELRLAYQERLIRDPGYLRDVGEFIGKGNKLVLLHANGDADIVNEDAGHWRDGVWYSNRSYEPRPRVMGFVDNPRYLPHSTGFWQRYDGFRERYIPPSRMTDAQHARWEEARSWEEYYQREGDGFCS